MTPAPGPAVALVFSGQGSQRPGMGCGWVGAERWRLVAGLSDVVGRDLEQLLLHADAATLERTDNAQLATFALQMVVLEELRAAAPSWRSVVACAGHSLGEFSALVAAELLSRERGAELVLTRGRAMLAATVERPGTMAQVGGPDAATVEGVLAALRERGEQVWVANVNAPDRTVVSGTLGGVAAAEAELVRLGASVWPIPVGGAFHTPLMTPAADLLGGTFAQVRTRSAGVPVVSNVDARPHRSRSDWPGLIARQLVSPVLWTDGVRCLVEEMGCELLIEIGAGSPLTDLFGRMGLPGAAVAVDSPDALKQALELMGEAGPPPRPGARAVSTSDTGLRGRPPYGYRLATGADAAAGAVVPRMVPDERSAPVVRRIFRRYVEGAGLHGIAEELTADAVPSPSAHDRSRNLHHHGVAWSKGGVRAVLTNDRYVGRRSTDPGAGAAYPALVEPELFDAAQQAIAGRRTAQPAAGAGRAYVLRGRLRCGLCGRLMQGTWNNGEPYYRCRVPVAYAAANGITHPPNVYLRESRLTGLLDPLLAQAGARQLADRSQSVAVRPAAACGLLCELPAAVPEQRAATYAEVNLRLTYVVDEQVVRAKLGLGGDDVLLRVELDLAALDPPHPAGDDT